MTWENEGYFPVSSFNRQTAQRLLTSQQTMPAPDSGWWRGRSTRSLWRHTSSGMEWRRWEPTRWCDRSSGRGKWRLRWRAETGAAVCWGLSVIGRNSSSVVNLKQNVIPQKTKRFLLPFRGAWVPAPPFLRPGTEWPSECRRGRPKGTTECLCTNQATGSLLKREIFAALS